MPIIEPLRTKIIKAETAKPGNLAYAFMIALDELEARIASLDDIMNRWLQAAIENEKKGVQ